MVRYNGPSDEPVTRGRWASLADDVAPILNEGDGVYTDQVISSGAPCPRLMLIERDMRILVTGLNPPEDHTVLGVIQSHL